MKYKTIFLCNHPEQVNYVYSPDRKARLAELTDLREGTVTAEELANGGFSDVEIVFSTWGMPSLSEEELAKYLPTSKRSSTAPAPPTPSCDRCWPAA